MYCVHCICTYCIYISICLCVHAYTHTHTHTHTQRRCLVEEDLKEGKQGVEKHRALPADPRVVRIIVIKLEPSVVSQELIQKLSVLISLGLACPLTVGLGLLLQVIGLG